MIIFFIKQSIYEIQEEKQIIPEIILLCSLYMYIHTFANNKVDVYIKIKSDNFIQNYFVTNYFLTHV